MIIMPTQTAIRWPILVGVGPIFGLEQYQLMTFLTLKLSFDEDKTYCIE